MPTKILYRVVFAKYILLRENSSFTPGVEDHDGFY